MKDGKGRDLSLALANRWGEGGGEAVADHVGRSAALVRLQQSELALQDIEAALEAGYPQELRYKLLDRRLRLHAARGERELYHDNLSQLAQVRPATNLHLFLVTLFTLLPRPSLLPPWRRGRGRR